MTNTHNIKKFSSQNKRELLAKLLQEKVEKPHIFPMSFTQQRLWFIDQLQPGNFANHIHTALRLTGSLNKVALLQTLNEILRRHEVLRTTFATMEGKPVQVIIPYLSLDLPTINLEELTEVEQEAELHKLVKQEIQQPFDLSQAPLLRATLLRLKDTEHILVFTMHHIISDGWSMGVLVKEVTVLYEAFSKSQPSPLAELQIQYVDFAAWQRQKLQGEVLKSQISYWKQQLEGAPQLLELPTDKPRPAVSSFQGATYSFELSYESHMALKKLSQQQGITLFTSLLAAFKTLLYHYTGAEDIVIGSPIANRDRIELEGLIGLFANTIALRTNLAGNPTFEELLTSVRKVALGASAHQDLPFEQLVEEIQPQRNLSYTPVFQVMFILQNTPMSVLELPGLTISPLEIDNGSAKFDLTLEITETAEKLFANLEFNTDLFEAATIKRMAEHFQILLKEITVNPKLRLSELSLLTEAEKRQLLQEWNNTEVEYSLSCIHELFEAQVEKTPDGVAVVFENQQLTYRQLNQWANQLAHYLQSLEVSSGVLVGICFEPSLEQVVSLLAVLKANGVYVPLDPNYPQERLSFMLENSNVRTLLTQQFLTEKISSQNAHIVCLDRDRDAIGRESVENLNLQTTLDDLAYAIYTSGSTGKPKAVLGKVRGIVNRLHWMWEILPFEADEVCTQKTSINFVDHVAEIFSPLLKGIPLVVVPDNIRGDIPQLMSLLSDKKITRIVLVPSLLKAMLDSAPQQLTKLQYLKYVFCSGEALPLALANAFNQKLSSARLFNLYGSSEVAADVTCFEVNFWETRKKILQYFKPQVIRNTTENQFTEVDQKPFTKPGVSPEMLATKFQRSELPLYPVTVDDYYDQFNQEVLPYAVDTGSPTYIGHMTSALPDFMHDMSKMISRLNQNLVKIETSKSLIFLEREAIAILHRLVYGFSGEFYEENIQQKNRNLGIITTGGTTANISALLCARNSGLLSKENSWELSKESLYKVLSKKGYDDIVIIGSRLMHYSLNKAASMLGLGTDNIVFIDSNNDGKLDINLLKEKICECRKNKLYILALVGIAGTTETGEIDPLFEMGDIAQEFGIHFHVDAAWGGATIFSDKHKGKLKGINKADSITICGHKQLYLPQGISVCLFKDPQTLNFAETTARYQAQRDTFDVGRFTIEGSRSAISLCLHGALHIIGKKGYEILINNSIEKAQYFSRLIEQLEPFELIMEPALNIVNYRYIPEDLRAKATQKSLSDYDIQRINQLNTQIQREQFEQGLTFVSKTTLMDSAYDKDKEIVVFRTVLSNPNTTVTDLHSVLEDQLRIANQIEAESKEKGDTEAAVEYFEAIHLQLADDPKTDMGEALEEYLKKNTIPIGKPISNTQIYILDKYGSLLPPGITGELYVGGDGLAQEYLNLPELTQEKFIPNPFTKDNGKTKKAEEARLYKTGDLARWLPNGNIEFVGRIDHQVKIRGFRIELGEIEAVVSQHSAVREVVVLVREDSVGSQRIVAYVVAQKEQILTITELWEFLESKLPNYMIPNALLTLEALPLTPNGKLDRKALPVPELTQVSSSNIVPASTPIENLLAGIWAEILGIEKVGIYNNFFELGGHSLIATRVLSQIRQVFKVDLPLRCLFEKPTITGLAKEIEKAVKLDSSLEATSIERIPRSQQLPLSFAQQRLWFLAQLEPDSPFYNIPAAVRLEGELNVEALQQSFNEIVRRHEALRSNFQTIEGQPVAVISEEKPLTLSIFDISDLTENQQEAEVKQQAAQEVQHPFEISSDHLLRVKLLRLSEQEHIVLLTMHHIVSDGWSVGVLVQEFATLYQAFCNQEPISYRKLPVQYVDFAAWQRQWLQGEVLETQVSYWLKQLENAPEVLELPTDHPRPAIQTFRGANYSFELSQELSAGLAKLSQQQGTTLFMTLLAGFQTLLWRYTAQEDIVVGSPIANRNRAEIEGLIGFFVNTLVLRTNLGGNPSFEELLKQVREVALGAYAHQDLPFELLVEQMKVERDLSHSPLFQVMFVLQNAPMSALELPDLTLSTLESDKGSAQFDLTLYMTETQEGLEASLEYNTDLFEKNTICRMVSHLQTLLEGIVANPQQRLSDLPLLRESEQHQLLVEWNNTLVEYSQDKCIHELFETQVQRTPDAIAVVFEDQQLTYRELNAKANQVAHYLRSLGVKPEVLVGICVERSLEMVIGLLAILKAGGAYVPLDPNYPQERLAYMLEDSQPSVLLTQQYLLESLPSHQAQVICIDSAWEQIASESTENPASNITINNLAYVIYTSGSTGKPKGAMNSHSGICNRLLWMQDTYQLTSADAVLQKTPFSFDVSVWEFFWTLMTGARLVVAQPEGHRDPNYLVNLIRKQRITTLHFVPSMLQAFLEAEGLEKCQSLVRVIVSGEALPAQLQQRFFNRLNAQLHNLYGPTEAAVDVTYWQCKKDNLSDQNTVPIGQPIANIQVYLLDKYLNPVPMGVTGEVYIGGVGVGRGYLNRPDLSAEKFIPNPFSTEPTRLYKTGDLAQYLPSGDIEYIGRIDNQVKIRGFRIELGEIEAVISQYPAVRETVVVVREDSVDSQRIVAYVVAQKEQTLAISELRNSLESKLPSYMVPTAFVTLETLPLTPNGKVDCKALPAPNVSRNKAEFVLPRNSTEEMVATIYAEILKQEKISINDNFFELGGHSLLATQVISRLHEAFEIDFPIRILFQKPTVASLAEHIEITNLTIEQISHPPIAEEKGRKEIKL